MSNIVLGGSAGGKQEDFTKAFEQPVKSSNQGAKTPGAETGVVGKAFVLCLSSCACDSLPCFDLMQLACLERFPLLMVLFTAALLAVVSLAAIPELVCVPAVCKSTARSSTVHLQSLSSAGAQVPTSGTDTTKVQHGDPLKAAADNATPRPAAKEQVRALSGWHLQVAAKCCGARDQHAVVLLLGGSNVPGNNMHAKFATYA